MSQSITSLLGTYTPTAPRPAAKLQQLMGGSTGPARVLAFITWFMVLALMIMLAVDRGLLIPRVASTAAAAAAAGATAEQKTDATNAENEHDAVLAACLGVSIATLIASTAAAFAPCAK
jgi:hypothetical protein